MTTGGFKVGDRVVVVDDVELTGFAASVVYHPEHYDQVRKAMGEVGVVTSIDEFDETLPYCVRFEHGDLDWNPLWMSALWLQRETDP